MKAQAAVFTITFIGSVITFTLATIFKLGNLFCASGVIISSLIAFAVGAHIEKSEPKEEEE